MAALLPAAQPEEPAHMVEPVRRSDRALPPAGSSDHTTMDAETGMRRVTLRRSGAQERRTLESVRANVEGPRCSTTT